mmetsp:Transcript_23367/g.35129  ORF Transcript_23367/g.35129 Transcript_23367/m.35129 type:complete len:85 (+) Transcript_23367:140-394(+)
MFFGHKLSSGGIDENTTPVSRSMNSLSKSNKLMHTTHLNEWLKVHTTMAARKRPSLLLRIHHPADDDPRTTTTAVAADVVVVSS